MQPELDLGKAEDFLVACQRHAIVAGHRQLQTTTKAEAVDDGNGRTIQALQAVKHLLPHTYQFIGPIGRVDAGELLDIGPHDKGAFFPGMQHESLRWIFVQRFNDRMKLLHYVRRQHIGAGFGMVDG